MDIALGEVIHFDIITSSPTTGAAADADSTPTFDVYEEATDTGLLGATNFTKRTGLTGNYRGTFTLAGSPGFAVGKWYTVVASATVGGVAAKAVAKNFRVCAAETTAGYPLVDANTIATAAVDSLVDSVWDEVLTGATHNVTNSAGRRLRQLNAMAITSGTAQAGASNSITLAAGDSATNEIYDSNLIVIIEGTGIGQARVIVEYNGTSKVAIVDRVWEVTPDNTSVYEMIADHQSDITHHGLAQAGGAASITLSSTASATDDVYVGSTIYLSTSTGTGQARLITDYNGTTKVATVSPAWAVNPGANTVYKILPIGRAIVDSGSVDVASINADATAAANLAKTTRAIVRGTATTGGTTTSIPTSAFSPAGGAADQFKGKIVTFDADTTTAALRGQSTDITASTNSATPTLTVTALTTAPASGDTFSVT